MTYKGFMTAVLLTAAALGSVKAQHYVLSTEHTSIGITANKDGKSYIQYYGARIGDNDLPRLFALKSNYTSESYPAFGLKTKGQKAIAAIMPDGNYSLDLAVSNTERTADKDGQLLIITLRDKVYPVQVRQVFKAYAGTDIIGTWTEISNQGKKSLKLTKFSSAYIPLERGDNYMLHYHGEWACENYIDETKMPNGEVVINEKDGLRTAWINNPTVMMTLDGASREEQGEVFGGALMWGGNYKIQAVATNQNLHIIAGMNEENSNYTLDGGETLTTPEFAMTYSQQGKGGVSRAFHRWARRYALQHGNQLRDILLNSWEGVYFNVNQAGMEEMMKNIKALGGELFVMDDGWFGDKWARNNGETGLGDWMVNKKKLPEGVKGLVKAAKRQGVKFGIWIEPEMANTKSELYEKHPEWVLQCKNRPLSQGRGGTQVVLDLCNPKVQDYVFGITDNLLTENPEIAYIKWDCNAYIMDYGSTYLPADRQEELYIRYHQGLRKVLQRIRDKYPDVIIQCCSSGGGRISYGYLPWYDEFWTSDNTDAYQRVFLQWSASQFYPAIAMAAHASASPNHQTKREVPLKFRFDVAMSGRLGLELQPKDMSEQEREFAQRAIASYKEIRPVVQLGDLYRLVSPYDKGSIAALMYANEDKSRLVFFGYNIQYLHKEMVPYVKLSGADENKTYVIKDMSPADAAKPCFLDGKKVSGKVLRNAGLKLNDILKGQMSSVCLEFVAE
ncbi:MAG: alpha-galactosidase [Bacteroidaceae bacterium]|nr:alpha-galactosidase [Bacteroidaceae bacterium]